MKRNPFFFQFTCLNNHKPGFTLIEFLIVAVILGIVGTLGVMAFAPSMEKARDGKRKADLESLTKVIEAFHADYGRYPASTAEGTIQACGIDQTMGCNWGTALIDDKGSVYMAKLPSDPKAFDYYYLADVSGNWYVLLARLENELDPARIMTTDPTPVPGVYTLTALGLTSTACGGEGCNYVHYGPTQRPDWDSPIVPD